jgi:PBSX family phage terminase large subunit
LTAFAPLVGKQLASVRHATAPGNLWEGAVRSSKTICSIMRWLEYIIHGPPGNLAMIGKTERTLRRNVLDVIVDMIGPRRCKITSGIGRKVYLAGANDEGAATKIQGMTLAGFYGDEVPTWPESVFAIARTRLSVPGATWFGTGNPGASNHWLKKEFIDRARFHVERDGSVIHRDGDDAIELHVFSFTLADNPSLPAEFVRRLMREYVGVFYRRFILGEWCMAEGAIFSEWDEKLNTLPRSKMPHMAEWLACGVDYGTSNPFHAGLLALGPDLHMPGESALYVTDEWRWDSRRQRRQLSPQEYSARVRAWLRDTPIPGTGGNVRGVQPEMVAVDPAAADFRVQLYRDGLPTRAADNDVINSIASAMSLIAARKIIVAEECAGLLAEIPGYVWDDKAAKLGEERPLKIDDHGIDSSLRYAPYSSRHLWHDEIWTPAAA